MTRISDNMENQFPHSDEPALNREAIYIDPSSMSPLDRFRFESYNWRFKISPFLTWVTLALLIVGYPALSLVSVDGDPTTMLKNLDSVMRMVVLVSTIIMLWTFFALVAVTTAFEKTGLKGVGFHGLLNVNGTTSTHVMLSFVWGIAFFLGAVVFLSGMAWVMAQIGLPMPGELHMLVPQDAVGRLVWIAVSITAGVCEETLFRGYIMTRLRLIFGFQSWVVPVIVSSLVFGICHSYQGLPGMILLSVYGALFALLYIRTGSLWPGIIAHSLQDLMALFIPR